MTTWAVALQTRELFVGLRLGFTDPEESDAPRPVSAGDEVLFHREGRSGFEGRILQTNSRGAVIEVKDLSRWLVSPVSYAEKRRSSAADKAGNIWIVRERLP